MQHRLRGLILDWGGVLTSGLHESMSAWAESEGIDLPAFIETMRFWLGADGSDEAVLNPVHALERGQMTVPDFERQLVGELTRRCGVPRRPDGLVERMFDHFEHAPEMTGLVRRAKDAGIRTALLSNSWGNRYPADFWDGMFDAVVISGEVGMRKPEPEIYRHTLALLDLPATECVFVDDLLPNITAAVELGLVGVHHCDYATTARELEVLFDVPLA